MESRARSTRGRKSRAARSARWPWRCEAKKDLVEGSDSRAQLAGGVGGIICCIPGAT